MTWTTWNGEKLKRETRSAAGRGAEDTANIIGEISDSQIPHDEGTLQRSKFITQNPNNETEWIISYGGGPGTGFPRVPYAFHWHETPASFQKGRKSKYLRDPLFQTGPSVLVKSVSEQVAKAWN